MKFLHILGRKNHGKTTLIEELIPELRRRGLRVGTIKHCGHRHELDAPGKDSNRHREAGAETVLVITPDTAALFRSRKTGEDFYEQTYSNFAGCDLVLIEGDAAGPGPKLEVWRSERGTPPMAHDQTDILAVISDEVPTVTCPVWPRGDVAAIAAQVEKIAAPRCRVPAYILAGGRSSRYGSNKARARVDGRPLIAAVADVVRPVASRIIAVAGEAGEYADTGLVTIADQTRDLGPLGGFQAAFAHAAGDPWLLVLACDLAGLRTEWITALLQRPRDGLQAVYYTAQPLVGLYHQSLRPQVDSLLEGPRCSVHALLERANKLSLPEPEGWETLRNVNWPDDLPGHVPGQGARKESACPRR